MIQPTSNFLGYNRADATSTAAPHAAPSVSPTAENVDRLSSLNSDALQSALNHIPEVRPDVVARGQRLLVDLNYPPREIIAGLAKLFKATPDLSEQA